MRMEMNLLLNYSLLPLGRLLRHEGVRKYTGLHVTEYATPIVASLSLSELSVVVG